MILRITALFLFIKTATSMKDIEFNSTFGNQTSETILELPLHVLLFGTLLYSIVFFVGVCGNIMVIVVLFKNLELRNCTNYFLANLSLADLLILFFCVPTALHDLYAHERWYLGKIMCKLTGFIENCVGVASIFTMLFISCERFLAICEPFHVQRIITKSRTLKFIALIWIVSIIINSPFIYYSQYEENQEFWDGTNNSVCRIKLESSLSIVYIIFDTFIIYLIIGIILLVIYLNICKSLTKSTLVFNESTRYQSKYSTPNHLNNIKKVSKISILSKKSSNQTLHISLNDLVNGTNEQQANHRNHTESGSFSLHNRNQHDAKKIVLPYAGSIYSSATSLKSNYINNCNMENNKLLNINNNTVNYLKPRRQLIFMLICVIVAFYVCIFPSKISLLLTKELSVALDVTSFYYVNILIRVSLFMNSCVNPILYNWLSTKFRRCFMKALGCQQNWHASNFSTKHDVLVTPSSNCTGVAFASSPYSSSSISMKTFNFNNLNLNDNKSMSPKSSIYTKKSSIKSDKLKSSKMKRDYDDSVESEKNLTPV